MDFKNTFPFAGTGFRNNQKLNKYLTFKSFTHAQGQ